MVLSMDMAFMKAGNVTRNYEEQLIELGEFSKNESRVIPFVHVDPRRKKIMELVQKMVD